MDEKDLAVALKKKKGENNELNGRRKRYIGRARSKETGRVEKRSCYEMPSLCDKVMAYDKTLAPVEMLKHAEALSEELVIPNVHEGRVTLEILKKWGGKSFRVEGSGPPAQWHTCEVEALREVEETMERGSCVEILVAHARSRKEAMELLLRLRFYDPRNTKRDPRDIAASTIIKPERWGISTSVAALHWDRMGRW